ncbi:MAG: carotenoid 1,2-hydratase [Burkholderiales bacterium]|nr:carotenoid 1,2-hydratase [Burkholderiales bacterium]
MLLLRRKLLLAATLAPVAAHARVQYPAVVRRPLVFPRDHGAHPEYRTEWWYLTGLLDTTPQPLGFQITFFRSRTNIDPDNPSKFAARQLIIAHAAIADPARGSLLKDERVAREGFGLAQAAEYDTDVQLDRWRFARQPDGTYTCEIPGRSFTLRFTARPTQPILLQGEAGFSQKGPRPEQASYYYSQPQLAVEASLTRDGSAHTLRGVAWLDHEWSSTILDENAAGWDWVGMNLDDGSALTAFDIRQKASASGAGGKAIYAYASLRPAGSSRVQVYGPQDVRFEPIQRWTSPRTRAAWPVAQRIVVGGRSFETAPLMPDQELDSRASTGAVYWEGASSLLEGGRRVGRGYLEMTGYVEPIAL